MSPSNAEQRQQELTIHIDLSNHQMGTSKERTELQNFADRLESAVVEAGAGEYDGDELGGGECVMFFSGPDAQAIFSALHPLMRHNPLARGARVHLQDETGNEVVKQLRS